MNQENLKRVIWSLLLGFLLMGGAMAQSSEEVRVEAGKPSANPDQVFRSIQKASRPPNLFENGPLFNSAATGRGGADESVLFSLSRGMSTLGFAHGLGTEFRVADDFDIPGPESWRVEAITFFAYQTGSGLNSTITAVNLRIWDGRPGESGSAILWEAARRKGSGAWSNIFRVEETQSGMATDRPIMEIVVPVRISLGMGGYWLDWQSEGLPGLGGVWAPPIAGDGDSEATGNGLQSFDGGLTYGEAVDKKSGKRQGFPFIVSGTAFSGCGGPVGRLHCPFQSGKSCNIAQGSAVCNPTCGSAKRYALSGNQTEGRLFFISGSLQGVTEITGTAHVRRPDNSMEALAPFSLIQPGDLVFAASTDVVILAERLDIDEQRFPPEDSLNLEFEGAADEILCGEVLLEQEGGCAGPNNNLFIFGDYRITPHERYSDSRFMALGARLIDKNTLEVFNGADSAGPIVVENRNSGALTMLDPGETRQFIYLYPIPTLSDFALAILVFLLMVLGLMFLRRVSASRNRNFPATHS